MVASLGTMRLIAHGQSLFSRTARAFGITAVLVAATAACSSQDGRTLRDPSPGQNATVGLESTTLPPDQPMMTLSGPWAEGQPIDVRYTCDGLNVSPSLSWTGAPEGTASFAVVLTDLDATEYAHWVVANIAPATTSLPEDFSDPLVVVAANSAGSAGYSGPCPPEGTTHSYDITVYALSQMLEAQTGDPAPGLIAAIESAAIEAATTGFTFSR